MKYLWEESFSINILEIELNAAITKEDLRASPTPEMVMLLPRNIELL